MIHKKKNLVIDLDGTICEKKRKNESYENARSNLDVINKIREYKARGFYIIIYSSRNMQTFEGNIGKINAITLRTILEWLDKHGVPYDEIHMGKPWCGHNGFYVDDRTIRPSEFLSLSIKEINHLINKEKNEEEKNE